MATPQIEQPAEGTVPVSSSANCIAPELAPPLVFTQDVMPLLSAGEYLSRFRAHDASLYKSLLVVLALFAFWLAIESSYARFNELNAKHRTLGVQKKELKDSNRRGSGIKSLLATTDVVSDPEHASKDVLERVPDHSGSRPTPGEVPPKAVDDRMQEIKESKKEIENLKREAVQLSIIGTNLPSRLHYAPAIWLLALIAWMLFFLSARRAAHRNLAAYHTGLPAAERALGAAGEGKFWLAPIPAQIRLQAGQPGVVATPSVTREELCMLLGWNNESLRWSRGKLFVLALAMLILIARLTGIASAVGSERAVTDLEFTPPEWSVFGLPLTFLLAVLATGLLWFLIRGAAPAPIPSKPMAFRRAVIIGGMLAASGVLLAAGTWTFRERITTALGYRFDSLGRLVRKSPRYMTKQQKDKRRKNRNVWLQVRERSSLVFTDRKRKADKKVALHFADKAGRMRLHSVLPRTKAGSLVSVDLGTITKWLAETPVPNQAANRRPAGLTPAKELPLSPSRTTPFEEIALDRAGSNDLDEACRYLLEGARLTLQKSEPNLRILDLLAGLALKTVDPGKYLDPLIKLAETQLDRERSVRANTGPGAMASPAAAASGKNRRGKPRRPHKSPPEWVADALEIRLGNWRNSGSKWYRRWSTRYVWWHHPTQTRLCSWARKKKMTQPPPNPEVRQRAIQLL